jgi:hypothetical protein
MARKLTEAQRAFLADLAKFGPHRTHDRFMLRATRTAESLERRGLCSIGDPQRETVGANLDAEGRRVSAIWYEYRLTEITDAGRAALAGIPK